MFEEAHICRKTQEKQRHTDVFGTLRCSSYNYPCKTTIAKCRDSCISVNSRREDAFNQANVVFRHSYLLFCENLYIDDRNYIDPSD